MWEVLPLSLVYNVLKDVWRAISGRGRRLSPQEKVRLRLKWKTEFEERFVDRRQRKLRQDVIIRDMSRLDGYPAHSDREKGISSWFKAGFVGTYHRGIELGLSWENLVEDQAIGQLRLPNRGKGEEGNCKVLLIGYVPYENIESVDWEGDQYYGEPQIYCYFDARKKQPYERLAYCEEKRIDDDFEYYVPVAELDAVKKLSRKHGIK